MSFALVIEVLKGGPTSGNWGHAGVKGQRGGSAPQSGVGAAMSLRTGRDAKQRQEAKRAASLPSNVPVNEDTKAHVLSYIASKYDKRDVDDALKYLNHLIDGSDVSMRVPHDVITKIIADGKFKNQHETLTSEGALNPGLRAMAERNAFGRHLEDPEDFPVYGYMGTAKKGYDPEAFTYGSVRVVFHDNVKSRTSITVGDSLWPFKDKTQTGTPLLKPGPEGLDDNVHGLLDFASGAHDFHPGYIEAQIHGKLTTKDIKHVFVPDGASKAINALKNAGIPYTVYDPLAGDAELM